MNGRTDRAARAPQRPRGLRPPRRAAKALAVAAALSFGATCAALSASCTSTLTITPLSGNCEPAFDPDSGSPTLSFNLVSPMEGACITVADPKHDLVPVVMDLLGQATLRPPGAACANTCNCGYLALYVDGVCNAIAGTDVVAADLHNVVMPYGQHTLTVKIVWDLNDGGLPNADVFDAGTLDSGISQSAVPPFCPSLAFWTPYTRTVTIDVEPQCPDGGEADAGDASADDGGSGDSGSGDAAVTDASMDDAGDAGAQDAATSDAATSDGGTSDGGDGG